MNVFDTRDDLLVHFGCFLFFESPILDDMLEEFATRAVLHDEIEVIVVLYHFIQLNYMWMSNTLKNRYFSVYSIYIGLVFYLVFLQDLYCDFVAGYNVGALFDFTKCTFPFCFPNNETSNLFAFTIFLFIWIFFVSILLSGLFLFLFSFFNIFFFIFILIFIFYLFRIFGRVWDINISTLNSNIISIGRIYTFLIIILFFTFLSFKCISIICCVLIITIFVIMSLFLCIIAHFIYFKTK